MEVGDGMCRECRGCRGVVGGREVGFKRLAEGYRIEWREERGRGKRKGRVVSFVTDVNEDIVSLGHNFLLFALRSMLTVRKWMSG